MRTLTTEEAKARYLSAINLYYPTMTVKFYTEPNGFTSYTLSENGIVLQSGSLADAIRDSGLGTSDEFIYNEKIV